jgi:hypothetical protein
LRWPNCEYVETSARTGQGIDAAVARLLAMIEAMHQPPSTAKA